MKHRYILLFSTWRCYTSFFPIGQLTLTFHLLFSRLSACLFAQWIKSSSSFPTGHLRIRRSLFRSRSRCAHAPAQPPLSLPGRQAARCSESRLAGDAAAAAAAARWCRFCCGRFPLRGVDFYPDTKLTNWAKRVGVSVPSGRQRIKRRGRKRRSK